MAISKTQKTEILDSLTDKFSRAKSAVFARNDGINVIDISEFRQGLKKESSEYVVAKKTLIKLAAEKAGVKDLTEDSMDGPIGVVFGYEDEVAPARLTAAFAKKNEKLAITGGIFDQAGIDQDYVVRLASIPSREVLLGKLLGTMMSPVSGFARTLSAIPTGFVRVLSELSKR